jgi:uncharacterized protein YbjT (DUF2867 family)
MAMKKILITGSTGYIGRRLTARLMERVDLSVRLLVRTRAKVQPSLVGKVNVFEGDTFQTDTLKKALRGVDIAYYLIHSMGTGDDFEERDRLSAENFRKACIAAGVKRLIYLGGLGLKSSASKHLRSRIETGEILSAEPEKLQVIWIRAGIIIGSGSASFEIMRNLVQKLAIMVTPRWVSTITQPIAIEDVISYLETAVDIKTKESMQVDIGADRLNFKSMMIEAAEVMGLKRYLFPVPVLTPRISSYWLILFTPVPYKVAAALIEGLKSETIILNDNARLYFPEIEPMSFKEAAGKAMQEIEENQVISRWCDSDANSACDIDYNDKSLTTIFRDKYHFDYRSQNRTGIFDAIIKIGGEAGWHSFNSLWYFRGLIDKFFGGYGTNRGRRDAQELRVGDALDFWKVLDLRENKRLLLAAQMKTPGKGWLEFNLQHHVLEIIIHFLPNGLLGRIYWYLFLPFHKLIFKSMGEQIIKLSVVDQLSS